MVSKPKSGLGKGLVRTLAQSHSQTHSVNLHQHQHAHSAAHTNQYAVFSPLLSGNAAAGPSQPALYAPIVAYHPAGSVSALNQAIARRSANYRAEADAAVTAVEGETEAGREEQRRKGKGKGKERDGGWPSLPVLPTAAAVLGTSAYLALLPPIEGAVASSSTFSTTDAILGRFSDLIVAPHPSTRSPPLRSPHPIHSRGYTTTTLPSRNAAQPHIIPGFDYPNPLLAFGKSHPNPFSPGSGGDLPPLPTYNNFYTPSHSPPPPPSPGPGGAREPANSVNSQRPSETHTVLSPAPLAPTETGGSSGSNAGGLILTPRYLSTAPEVPTSTLPPAKEEQADTTALYLSKFIFQVGASGLAKDRPIITRSPRRTAPREQPPRPRSFPLQNISAPPKSEMEGVSVGEDSYFATPTGICVADGVGGWARSGRNGADAGRWSRLLTHFCHAEVKAWWAGAEEYCEDVPGKKEEGGQYKFPRGWSRRKGEEKGREGDSWGLPDGKQRRKLDPVEVMQRGFEKCLACVLAEGIYGSSTCLLAVLHHTSLRIANLGDCCLLVVRDGEVVFRTKEMQHAFNFPHQVGTHSRDEPMKDAEMFEVEVRERDVVVVGSDGLMDNLFDQDILDCLAEFAPPSEIPSTFSPLSLPQNAHPTPPPSRPSSGTGLPLFNPQKVSEALCNKAREVSEEPNAETPFMVRCIEEGMDFVGGKKDDISVVVGVIGQQGEHFQLRT